MLLLLKNEEPTNELIRLLLSRETKSRGDPFVTSALRYNSSKTLYLKCKLSNSMYKYVV